MRCQDVQERLILLLSEELPPEESGRIHKHLENCAACRHVFDEQRITDIYIRREVSRAEAPVFYNRKKFGYRRISAAAAVLLLTATLLILSRREQPGSDLVWDNGDMEELIILTNDLDQLDPMAISIPGRQVITPEFISIESRVSYLERDKQ